MKRNIIALLLATMLFSCTTNVQNAELVNEYPKIYPDYIDVTIPQNIAPLNFYVKQEGKTRLLIQGNGQELCLNGLLLPYSLSRPHPHNHSRQS